MRARARATDFFRAISGKERGIAGVALAATNVYGLAALFSDLGPREPPWLRVVLIAMLYIAGGAAVGALLPRRWHLAVLGCGTSTLMGALAFSYRWTTGAPPLYWTLIVLELSGPPTVTLAAAYLGSRYRRRLETNASGA
jgi:hypothetical protein